MASMQPTDWKDMDAAWFNTHSVGQRGLKPGSVPGTKGATPEATLSRARAHFEKEADRAENEAIRTQDPDVRRASLERAADAHDRLSWMLCGVASIRHAATAEGFRNRARVGDIERRERDEAREAGAMDFDSFDAVRAVAKKQGATRAFVVPGFGHQRFPIEHVEVFRKKKGGWEDARIWPEGGKWHLSTWLEMPDGATLGTLRPGHQPIDEVDITTPASSVMREDGPRPYRTVTTQPMPITDAEQPVRRRCTPWVRIHRDPRPYEACVHKFPHVGNAGVVYEMLAPELEKEDNEVFLVILLDGRNRVKGLVELARGGRSGLQVEPQAVVREMLVHNASALIVVHNHPSGVAHPSPEDIRFTQAARAKVNEMQPNAFLDHVIVGDGEFYSFDEGRTVHVKPPARAPAPPEPTPNGGSVSGEAREEVDPKHPHPWLEVSKNDDGTVCLRPTHATFEEDLAYWQRKAGPIGNPKNVYVLLHDDLGSRDQEKFVLVPVDVRQNIRGVVEVHRGQRSRVGVAVVDALRALIMTGAEGAVIVHQHPSGNPSPSDADKNLTKSFRKAIDSLGGEIALLDHVILGKGAVYSFAAGKVLRV